MDKGLIGIIAMITLAIFFLIAVLMWDSNEKAIVDSMDCNELWEEIQKNVEEYGGVGEYAFSKWIVRECWS